MLKPKKKYLFAALAILLPLSLLLNGNALADLDPATEDHYDLKLLGKYVFFDKISEPQRMACVTCHDPATGGTGSVSGVNLHQVVITGADPHTAGNLKPPSNAYANFSPPFHECNTGGLGGNNYCGGNFWDGRAEGNEDVDKVFPTGATKHLGEEIFQGVTVGDQNDYILEYAAYFGSTADQALNPMPNIVEHNKQRLEVCLQVASSKYAPLYEQVWGEPIDCSDEEVDVSAPDVDWEMEFDISFKRLMLAVCAWQHSADLNSFSSIRDLALYAELACLEPSGDYGAYYNPDVCVHEDYLDSPGVFPLVGLTEQENYGHDLFYATRFAPLPNGKFSNCAFCHADNPVVPGPGIKDTGDEPLQIYSAQDYHNIGTPANPEIPDLNSDDPLLQPPLSEGIKNHSDPDVPGLHPPGFFRTPTLRNVDKRKDNDFIKAYTHNGWFKSLESLVHFYNTAFIPGATAQSFGITQCEGAVTEKEALQNNCWPEPEFGDGPSAVPFLVGNLGLTLEDEAAIVAYMKTFTDMETSTAPPPYSGPHAGTNPQLEPEKEGKKKKGKK